MTRLITEQVAQIPQNLDLYDLELRNKTGCNLRELAAGTAGIDLEKLFMKKNKVAVIPVTAGEGKIEGFSEALKAIALHLDFDAVVAKESDVRGLVEAYENKFDLIMLADDYQYAAINLHSRKVADNDRATACGYVYAFKKMAGSLKGRDVLLIGAGAVGSLAAQFLALEGANLQINDLNRQKAEELARLTGNKFGVKAVAVMNIEEILPSAELIFDASPVPGLIPADLLNNSACIAAPGIPLGLTPEAAKLAEKRLIHDPLQIGTAVMLYTALQ